jgi:AcrR family transcriptional regulator
VSTETDPATTDGRRAAGAETRRRLVAAAADLLAEHGEPGVTLRAISKAADANSAAVQYHFGSREALIREVVTDAARQVVTAQMTALTELAERKRRPTAADWMEAWAMPLIRVATGSSADERRLGRIVGQGLAAPLGGPDVQLRELTTAPTERLIDGLEQSLPTVGRPELVLRVALAASALAGFASGTFEPWIAQAHPERELHARILGRLTRLVTGPA